MRERGNLRVTVEPAEIQALTSLGLTVVQAKVYFALARAGILKIADISKQSNVARPDVYRTLTQLYDLGLVEKVIQVPAQFKALPIDEGIKILLKKKQVEYEKIEHETQALLGSFKKKTPAFNLNLESSYFIMVPSKDAILNRLKQALRNSQQNVSLVITWKRFINGMGDILFDDIKDAAKRKIKVRFIVQKPPAEVRMNLPHLSWVFKKFEVRFIEHFPKTVFGIYDNRELYIIVNPSADLSSSAALWTNNSSLIALVQEYFETLWLTAKEEPQITD